jgi:hypothetical protein
MANFSGKRLMKTITGLVATAIMAAALVFIPFIPAKEAAKPVETEAEDAPVLRTEGPMVKTWKNSTIWRWRFLNLKKK